MTATDSMPVGYCRRCGLPVHAGEEQTETVEHGTAATPDIVLHRDLCARPVVRRHSGGAR